MNPLKRRILPDEYHDKINFKAPLRRLTILEVIILINILKKRSAKNLQVTIKEKHFAKAIITPFKNLL
jgi:hypothetical protein